ncbi:MAG TPA: TonB-dependent receptor, partial [Lacunisphaera sp.]|nr:TonB-dependent receptor [Lacunisphaera sp.]
SGGEAGVNALGRMYIDVNSKLPDGRANPNFLQPYGEFTHRTRIIDTDNTNARLAMAYVLDDTRLGSFRFNLMGGYSSADTATDRWTYALKDNADPRQWATEKDILFRYYQNDVRRPFDITDRQWLYLDRNATTPRVVEAAEIRGTNESASGNSLGEVEYSYAQFAIDAKFFKKRLNLLSAVRLDSYSAGRRDSIAQFDYPTNWDGRSLILKPDAPADWSTLTYNVLDGSGNPSGVLLPADIRPRTGGVADPRYAGVRFQDDFSNPTLKDTVTTFTTGAVYHLTRSVSVFANYAESFVPLTTNFSIAGTMLGAQSGEGRDFGVRFTTPGDKIVANLIRYEGKDNNALSASVANTRTYIANIIQANAIGDNNSQGINQRNLPIPPSGINDTVTKELSGWEFEVTANLTPNWRLMLNGALSDGYQTDTYHHMREYLGKNLDTLRLIVQDAGGVFNGDTATVGPVSSIDGASAVTGWNNLMNWRASLTDEKQILNRLTDATGNLYTDYSFRKGHLKGLRVGAGLNYRGKSVIGYRGGDTIRNPANPNAAIDDPGVGALDPVYQPGYTTATATLNYDWRISKKLRCNLTLRVSNLFDYDKPVYFDSNARPVDGDLSNPARTATPINFFWVTPRSVTLTAGFRF